MKKIKLGPEKIKHKGKIFNIKQREVFFPDGEKDIYEFCERPASVSVLALNEKKELLLINEYRYGYKKNVWFLPGGRVDQKNDTPKKAAQRELREEGGFRAKKLKLIRKNHPSNTLMWDIYIFFATDLVYDPLPLDKGEEVSEIKFVPLKKAVQMAVDGTIENEFIAYNIIRFEYMLRHGEFKI